MKTTLTKLSIFVISATLSSMALAIPNIVDAPVENANDWYHYMNGKQYNWFKYNHHSNDGISGAKDAKAFDLNMPYDADNGQPVYAVESGNIYTGYGWGGKGYNQILINHTTNGDKWSSGYLHMKNLQKTSGWVNKGDLLGYVSNKSSTTPNMANHLHFVLYDTHGKYGLKSVRPYKINKNVSYSSSNDESYFILTRNGSYNGKKLAFNAYKPKNNSKVNLYKYLSWDNDQKWLFDGDLIRRINTNTCLNAKEIWDTGKVRMANCNANSSRQKWVRTPVPGTNYYRIKLKGTNFCLNTYKPKHKSLVNLYSCVAGDKEQHFQLK